MKYSIRDNTRFLSKNNSKLQYVKYIWLIKTRYYVEYFMGYIKICTKFCFFFVGGGDSRGRKADHSSSSWKTGSYKEILRNVHCQRRSTARNWKAEIVDRYPKECQKRLEYLQSRLLLPTSAIWPTFFYSNQYQKKTKKTFLYFSTRSSISIDHHICHICINYNSKRTKFRSLYFDMTILRNKNEKKKVKSRNCQRKGFVFLYIRESGRRYSKF